MDSVFLLWYITDEDADDNVLIGVYRAEQDARAAIERLKEKPGFVKRPEKFVYEKYELNQDHWTEGFVSG